LKDKEIYITYKLVDYINPTNLFVFSKIVYSKRVVEKHKAMADKFNFKDIFISFGGAILLNLRGNKGNLDIPGKLPKQQS
jgi:hypothetical protein